MGCRYFTEKIIAAATKSIPRTSGRIGPKAWYRGGAAICRRRKCLRSLRHLQQINPEQPEAMAKFQAAKAEARKAIKEAKEKSWESFVLKISPHSTTTELWRTVNTLRVNRTRRSVMLKRPNGFTENPEEVAEELVTYYGERSATSSYPPSFQMAKMSAEREPIDVSSNTGEAYNVDITLAELLWALDKGQGASTGTDGIGYPLLQRLPVSVKFVLLELSNKIWRNGEPSSFRFQTVKIPIQLLSDLSR